MAELHPLVAFHVGDTWEIAGTCNSANGPPINLAGATVEWILEDAAGNIVFNFSLSSGIAVISAATGEILITVTPSQSQSVAPGRCKDSLRVTDSGGIVSTQWVGFIDVRQSLFTS